MAANIAKRSVINAAATAPIVNGNVQTETADCIADIIVLTRLAMAIARIFVSNVAAFTVAVCAVMSDVMAATIKSVPNATYANPYVKGIRTIPTIMMTVPVIVTTSIRAPIATMNT